MNTNLLTECYPGTGIDHWLHSPDLDEYPDTVLYQGIEVALIAVDFYECALPSIGWVPLDEKIQPVEDYQQ